MKLNDGDAVASIGIIPKEEEAEAEAAEAPESAEKAPKAKKGE
jgi:hypothetical protein